MNLTNNDVHISLTKIHFYYERENATISILAKNKELTINYNSIKKLVNLL